MDTKQVREIITKEFPAILKKDIEIQKVILEITHPKFADKTKTNDRFEKLLEEFRRDREENQIENKRNREEQNKKWEENQTIIRELLLDIRRLDRKFDATLGALGHSGARQQKHLLEML